MTTESEDKKMAQVAVDVAMESTSQEILELLKVVKTMVTDVSKFDWKNFWEQTRRTAKKVRIKVCRKESIPLSLARSYIGRYGAIKHSDTKRFQKKYHVLEDLKRCKEIVSTHERRLNNYGKDEIYAATVKCSILSA